MSLSRDEFLKLGPQTEIVDLGEHGKVTMRGLTAKERDDYEQGLIEFGPNGQTRVKTHQENPRATLVVRCLVDDEGERLFADDEVDVVGRLDSSVISQLWDVARRLSGMGTEEEAAEGFDNAQDDVSAIE